MNERQTRPTNSPGGDADPAYAKTVTLSGTADGTSPGAKLNLHSDAENGLSCVVAQNYSRYTILRKIDQGGMGVVYEARDEHLNRVVALKVLLKQDNALLIKRFTREAQITSMLEHPNIIPTHELGQTTNEQMYFTMKMVQGNTLAQQLIVWHKRTLDRDLLYEALTILIKACDAVAFAHSKGVVHRDLKPANIMLGPFGEVLVMDWGLASSVSDADLGRPAGKPTSLTGAEMEDASRLTADGDIVGTPGYMSPEQVRGELEFIRPASDQYSIGVILYELLTRAKPCTGKTSREVLAQTMEGKFLHPSMRAPERGIPPELEAVTMRALALDPAQRYAALEDLAQDLRQFIAGFSVSARPDGLWRSLVKLVRRNLPLFATAAVAGLTIITISAIAFVKVTRDRDRAQGLLVERNQAQGERDEAENDRLRVLQAQSERAQRRMAALQPYSKGIELAARGSGFTDESAALLREAIALDAGFVEAHFALAKALRAQGDLRGAAASFLEANRLSIALSGKPVPQALLLAAFALDDLGQVDEEIACFSEAERVAPTDPLTMVGTCYRHVYGFRFSESLVVAEAAVQAAPKLWETHLAHGFATLANASSGRLPETSRNIAIADFRKSVALAPTQSEPHFWLAQALASTGASGFTEALSLLDRSVELDPKNPRRHIDRLRLRSNLGASVSLEGIADIRRMCVTQYQLAELDRTEAEVRKDQDGLVRALTALHESSLRQPMFTYDWLLVNLNHGRKAAIASDLKAFADAYAGSAEVALLQAYAANFDKDWAQAVEWSQSGLLIAPYERNLHHLLSASLGRLKRWDDSLAAARRGLQNCPNEPHLMFIESTDLFALKRFDEALLVAQHGVEVDPDNLPLQQCLVMALFRLDRAPEARKSLKDFVQQHPEHAAEMKAFLTGDQPKASSSDTTPMPAL